MAIFRKSKKIKNDVEYTGDLLQIIFNIDTLSKAQILSLPAVAEAVDKIASTIAIIPVKLYKETKQEDGKKVVEEIDDNRTAILNEDTKSTLDGFQFKKAIVTDYLIGKGGYAYIKRRRNEFTGVFYVKEEDIAFYLINEDPINRKYKIETWAQTYEPYEFLKILRNTKDGMQGIGVGDQIANALRTALQTLLLQLNLARTGGNKRGYIQSKNPLSKQGIEELKTAWSQMYANNDTRTIPVLNAGIEFKESSATSTEMQLNESRKQFNEEIAKVFHLDKDYTTFIKDAILPIITAFETALNRDFLLEKEKGELYWAFDINNITKASIKERYDAYKSALDAGWMTKNEVRYNENMDAIDGLDTINMGLGSVLYDTKTQEYFVPNTNSVYKAGEPTAETEQKDGEK